MECEDRSGEYDWRRTMGPEETLVNVTPLYLRFWYLEWVEKVLRKMCKSFKFLFVKYDSCVKFVYFSV